MSIGSETQVSMSPSRYSVIGTATYDAEAPQTMVLDAWWHLAMVCDTIRHAGWGLQNRKVQVRFLSHLPLNPELMVAAAASSAVHFACSDPT
jgi:hypothetical protein